MRIRIEIGCVTTRDSGQIYFSHPVDEGRKKTRKLSREARKKAKKKAKRQAEKAAKKLKR